MNQTHSLSIGCPTSSMKSMAGVWGWRRDRYHPLLVMLGGWSLLTSRVLVINAGTSCCLRSPSVSRWSHRLYGFPLILSSSSPQRNLGRSTFMPTWHKGSKAAYLWLIASSPTVYNNRSCWSTLNARSRRRRLFLPHKRPPPLATALSIPGQQLYFDPR